MTPNDDSRAQRSAPAPQSPPAGWYADPQGPGQRWWDGSRWTEHVHAAPPVVPVTTTDAGRDRAGILGGTHDRLSAEARAVRIVVILIAGAALVFGVIQFTDSITHVVQQQQEQAESPLGY